MKNIYRAACLCLAAVATGAGAEAVKTPHGGITLNANLEAAESWPGGPVVLMTHGTLAHSGMEIMRGLQTMLKDRGISSLAINLSLGLDDRQAAMYHCPTPHRHRHTDAVGEIGAWYGWLKDQGAQRIALFGHSRGGNQTARFAAADADAAVTHVFLAAPATWDEGKHAAGYEKRYGQPLAPLLDRARSLAEKGKGAELMGPMGFIYCADTRASADAIVSYYAADPDMDTPHVLPRIQAPVTVFAGSEDDVVEGLVEKVEAMADGDKLSLVVIDGADHFFRDLYSEDMADIVAEQLNAE